MYYQPEVIYREVGAERKNSVIRYIGNRVLTQNKNFLCAIVGQTGTGKSYLGVALCEDYSEMFGIPFDVKLHVISSLEQLLKLIIEKEFSKSLRVGTALLFEEPQVEHSSETWQSELNQMLTVLLSTFRNQRLVVFFTLPYLTMLSKKSRMLMHAEFKVMGFDKATGITTVKPRFLEYNTDFDKFYKKRLLVRYMVEGRRKFIKTRINKWYVDKASEPLLTQYEDYKAEFTADLNQKLYKKVLTSKREDDLERRGKDFMRVKEIYMQEGENYIKIIEEMPHLSSWQATDYVKMVKKSLAQSRKIPADT